MFNSSDEILFIGFIEKSENLITIDREGKIFLWNYESEYCGSDGIFNPKERFK
jgi:hypothetical protein